MQFVNYSFFLWTSSYLLGQITMKVLQSFFYFYKFQISQLNCRHFPNCNHWLQQYKNHSEPELFCLTKVAIKSVQGVHACVSGAKEQWARMWAEQLHGGFVSATYVPEKVLKRIYRNPGWNLSIFSQHFRHIDCTTGPEAHARNYPNTLSLCVETSLYTVRSQKNPTIFDKAFIVTS